MTDMRPHRQSPDATHRRRRYQAGFTLLELMISTVLVAIVLAAVITGFLAQNRLYRGLENGRRTEDSARAALAQMGRLVHMAGAGMSPAFAIDMDWYQCTGSPCRNNMAATAWDAGSAPPTNLKTYPGTDELVFYARSTHSYVPPTPGTAPGLLGDVWKVDAGSTSGSLLLEAHSGDQTTIPGNAVLLVTCPSAYTFFYATTAIAPVTLSKGAGSVSVPLAPSSSTSPYRQNTSGSASRPCISGGLARAYLINRYRFFVAKDPSSKRPFLYLDRGIDTKPGGSTIDPPEPVAADIDDLQVAYILRDGETYFGSSGKVLSYYDTSTGKPSALEGVCQSAQQCSSGDTCASGNCPTSYTGPGIKCCPQACSSDLAISSSEGFYKSTALFPCGLDAPQRQAAVPGNVVKVRLTLVARTARPAMRNGVVDKNGGDPPKDFSIEDHNRSGDPLDGYGRVRLSVTVDVPNTSATAIPMI